MQKEISIQGKKIVYRVNGNGHPVVLVHGFGENSDVWDQVIGGPPQTPPKEGLVKEQKTGNDYSLTEKFQIIIPDLPGSGQSELIDDMSIEGMADAIKQILDAEIVNLNFTKPEKNSGQKESSKVPPTGGFKWTIIGHSMGGYITLAFAEKYPDSLNAYGLFHSTAYADSDEKKVTREKGIEFIEKHGAFEFLKTSTPNLFSAKTRDKRPEMIVEQIAGLNNFSAAALVLYYRAMMQRPDRTAVLKETSLPVLFIMGKYDVAAPLKDVLEQCHLPEKSYIHILQDSGHMGMLEEPKKSNFILNKFLEAITNNPA